MPCRCHYALMPFRVTPIFAMAPAPLFMMMACQLMLFHTDDFPPLMPLFTITPLYDAIDATRQMLMFRHYATPFCCRGFIEMLLRCFTLCYGHCCCYADAAITLLDYFDTLFTPAPRAMLLLLLFATITPLPCRCYFTHAALIDAIFYAAMPLITALLLFSPCSMMMPCRFSRR